MRIGSQKSSYSVLHTSERQQRMEQLFIISENGLLLALLMLTLSLFLVSVKPAGYLGTGKRSDMLLLL